MLTALLNSCAFAFILLLSSSRGEEHGNPLIEQFIARKADILFCQAWKTVTHQDDRHEEDEDAAGLFCFALLFSITVSLHTFCIYLCSKCCFEHKHNFKAAFHKCYQLIKMHIKKNKEL